MLHARHPSYNSATAKPESLQVVTESQVLHVRLVSKLVVFLKSASSFSLQDERRSFPVLSDPIDSEAGEQDPLAAETSQAGGVARDVRGCLAIDKCCSSAHRIGKELTQGSKDIPDTIAAKGHSN